MGRAAGAGCMRACHSRTVFLAHLTDWVFGYDVVIHVLASCLRSCITRADLVVAHGVRVSKMSKMSKPHVELCYWLTYHKTILDDTEFILVQRGEASWSLCSQQQIRGSTVRNAVHLVLTWSATIVVWIPESKPWTYITSTMPRVSVTDWLNSQCADRLISAVLIGQVALKWRHLTGQPTPRKPTSALIVHSKNHSHIRTYDAQYTLPYT